MTPSQFERVFFALRHYQITCGFHGACHGGDREFHGMVHVPMELFPCNEEQHQWALATCAGGKDVIHPIDVDPIRRNHRIVDCCSLLVAAPGTSHEIVRGSGTWATIRYARKELRPLVICFPNGTIKKEHIDEIDRAHGDH